jgi:hypothetical protein
MPDIRNVLDEAAPPVGGLDVERLRRRARRRSAAPRVAALCAAVAVVVVGVVVLTGGDDGPLRHITTGTSPSSSSTTTPASTTVTTPSFTPGPTTTAPPTTAPPRVVPGEDRLSTESRLGYEGLGPIRLGMPFDEAVAAAHVTVQRDPTCAMELYGEPGSGVDSIAVWVLEGIDTIIVSRPGINTISGIHVGSTRAEVLATYPEAANDDPGGAELLITNSEGRAIVFDFDGDAVSSMSLFTDPGVRGQHALC